MTEPRSKSSWNSFTSAAVFGCLVAAAFLAACQPGPVSLAAAWLLSHQNASGSWGTSALTAGRTTTEVRDTAAATIALRLSYGETTQSRTNAIAWLNTSLFRDFDATSRIVRARGALGASLPADINRIRLARRPLVTDTSLSSYPGGGWGLAPDYDSDPIDTALVLRGLAAAHMVGQAEIQSTNLAPGATLFVSIDVPSDVTGFWVSVSQVIGQVRISMQNGQKPSSTVPAYGVTLANQTGFFSLPNGSLLPTVVAGRTWLRIDAQNGSATVTLSSWITSPTYDFNLYPQAIAFLRSLQNADGGFALRRGDSSDLYVTLEVLGALLDLRRAVNLQAAIAPAIAYVKSHQAANGSFAYPGNPPSNPETALAALVLYRAGDTTAYMQARSYLISQQSNGSLDNDPYATALGLLALIGRDINED